MDYLGWMNSLTNEQIEALFVVMRDLDNKSLKARQKNKDLSPPWGHIAVGGAHIEPLIEAEALESVNRALNKGASIDASIEAGKEGARLVISKWNASRKDYQVHYWQGHYDSKLEDLKRKLVKAIAL